MIAALVVGVETLGHIEHPPDHVLVAVVDGTVELLVGELTVHHGRGGVQRWADGSENTVEPFLPADALQVTHIGAEQILVVEERLVQFTGSGGSAGEAVRPGQLLRGECAEALVADGLNALRCGIVVELHIAPVHAMVAAHQVDDRVAAGHELGIEDL